MNIKNQLIIFPNPTKEKITVSLVSDDDVEKVTITIYTIEGSLLFTENTNRHKTVINVTSYTKGTYLIKLSSNKHVYWQKFIKQ